jgi:hypothetical protein
MWSLCSFVVSVQKKNEYCEGGDLVRSRNRTCCMHNHWRNRLCCLVLGCWISSKFIRFPKTLLHVPRNCNVVGPYGNFKDDELSRLHFVRSLSCFVYFVTYRYRPLHLFRCLLVSLYNAAAALTRGVRRYVRRITSWCHQYHTPLQPDITTVSPPRGYSGLMCQAQNLHSRSTGFESSPGCRLLWLTLVVVYLGLTRLTMAWFFSTGSF